MYEIVIGRSESEKKKYGLEGTIFLGKLYVKMGATTSLSNKVLLDVVKPHVVLVCGKRGGGKSYSLSVIAEEICNLPENIANNISVVMFDTMGIFWTMKYPNERQEGLLKEWDLKPASIEKLKVFVPEGYYKKLKSESFPVDKPFTIKASELTSFDWCSIFEIKLINPVGILVDRVINKLQKTKGMNYDLDDIIFEVRNDFKSEKREKDAAENLFTSAKSYGIFSKQATLIKDIVDRGKVSIIDISMYQNWNIKCLVTSLICKKLFLERMVSRKLEEFEDIKKGYSYFGFNELDQEQKEEMPLVWMLFDEMHEYLPKDRVTPATDALVQLLREGRQPGISMIMATQQPGEIHTDVITQSDIVVSHRITAKKDISALNEIMQTYLSADILRYLNDLPRMKGCALILDDNSERVYPIQVRPKFSWHGGDSPSAIKQKRQELIDLGL
ncbi:MAG: DUF87 domain-containing protein [Candidatus Nanoarchaeia archaeon]